MDLEKPEGIKLLLKEYISFQVYNLFFLLVVLSRPTDNHGLLSAYFETFASFRGQQEL